MKFDAERSVTVLSVTELCARALRAGDLGTSGGFSPERAAEGAEIHRKLQSESGDGYRAEVPLCNTTLFHNLSFEVSGRADGVFRAGDEWGIDEIKTVVASLPKSPLPLHLAQAKCYAYFLCREKEISRVRVRLTYCRVGDREVKEMETTCSEEELRAFYFGLLAGIESRAKILKERAEVRIPSAAAAKFPFSSVRAGQEILLRECYRDVKAGKRLFVEAPTGTGKTISTLYPAVRALGEGICDRIFYLTAKTSTGREAYRAAAQLYRAGAKLRTVILTAKEQLCRLDAAKADPAGVSRHCNAADCPYARGFYDRVGEAVCALLSERNGFPRTEILRVAEEYRLCPYELQLELSELCDILICDYNYVFDPHVYLRRYFDPEVAEPDKTVFLIDEAHNLGDRTTAMYSAELDSTEVEGLLRLLPPGEHPLREPIESLGVTLRGLKRLCRDTLTTGEDGIERGYYLSRNGIGGLWELISATAQKTVGWLRAHKNDPIAGSVEVLSRKLTHASTVGEYYDERFLTFVEVEGERRILRLICLDASEILDRLMNRARSTVLFSATLNPPDYFADILGGGKSAVRISLPSPFPPENLLLAAVTGISTRFEDREKSCKKISSVIAATVSAKPGNYIVYFPSYAYLEKVLDAFRAKYPQVPVVVQSRGMSAAEKETFLDSFRDDGCLRVGFCVLGGSFSEGVDLPGGRLIGTVVVGTGLPGISNERNLLRDYYDSTRENGFDYAYAYPGMNRVLQAAGRVIRREDDRGVIVLVDDRYGEARTQGMFPEHWNQMQYAGNASILAEMTADFWKKFLK